MLVQPEAHGAPPPSSGSTHSLPGAAGLSQSSAVPFASYVAHIFPGDPIPALVIQDQCLWPANKGLWVD